MVRKITRKQKQQIANGVQNEDTHADPQETITYDEEQSSPAPAVEPHNSEENITLTANANVDADVGTELSEEQMKENIRAGAKGLRDLVDKYQEQHRVMQEEVAEAIIRDVQEQNQLHRLTANVLRQQQAALSNPEYTRWAYENKKGEFSAEEDARRLRAAKAQDRRVQREEENEARVARGEAPLEDDYCVRVARSTDAILAGMLGDDYAANNYDDDFDDEEEEEEVASNKSGGTNNSKRSAQRKRKSHKKQVGKKKKVNKYDQFIDAENRWMISELSAFNASVGGSVGGCDDKFPRVACVDLDSIGDRLTLKFIKGNSSADTAEAANGQASAAFASKIPLPSTSTLQPILPPKERAANKLRDFFASSSALSASIAHLIESVMMMRANESESNVNPASLSVPLLVPFVNGSILWPIESKKVGKKNEATTGHDRSLAEKIVGATLGALRNSGNSHASANEVFGLWKYAALRQCFDMSELVREALSSSSSSAASSLEEIKSIVIDKLLVEPLVEGDAVRLLKDEGNLITLVPMTTSSPLQRYVAFRAFQFKGTVKIVEQYDAPVGVNALYTAGTEPNHNAERNRFLRTLLINASSIANSRIRSGDNDNDGDDEDKAEDDAHENITRPANIVRTFLVPTHLFSGEGTERLHKGEYSTDEIKKLASAELILVDSRALSPSIPLLITASSTADDGLSGDKPASSTQHSSSSLSWAELCGLARIDIVTDDDVMLRLPNCSGAAQNGRDQQHGGPSMQPLAAFDALSALTFPLLNAQILNPTTTSVTAAVAAEVSSSTNDANAPGKTLLASKSSAAAVVLNNESPSKGQTSFEGTNQTGENDNVRKSNDNSNKIEITPQMLAAVTIGVTALSVICVATGYWFAKRK